MRPRLAGFEVTGDTAADTSWTTLDFRREWAMLAAR